VAVVETPCVAASVTAEIAVSSTTATRAPGTAGANRLDARMSTTVAAPYANVDQLVRPSSEIHVHCCSSQVPVPLGTPSRSGIWLVSTWMPTPVRKPMSTDAERRSPRKPSRSSRATSSSTPVKSAHRLV